MSVPAIGGPPAGTHTRRDGSIPPFDNERIVNAIRRAGEASGELPPTEARLLDLPGGQGAEPWPFPGGVPDIERVQDIVEQTLIAANHLRTARAYISYRDRHERLRADQRTIVDVASSVNEIPGTMPTGGSMPMPTRVTHSAADSQHLGKVIANYWLSHVYAPEAGLRTAGDIHIHDLDMLAGYCAGWSLRTLLHEGLNGVPGKGRGGSAQTHVLGSRADRQLPWTLQNEWAGAQAFSSFDTYMAEFVRKDGLSYAQVKQYIQELIYNLNVPSRWGT